MKVLYWTELFCPHVGGVEVLSKQFLHALQGRGYEFVVVASHSGINLPDETDLDGIRVYRYHFQRALAHRNIQEVGDIAGKVSLLKQTFRPDLIHVNSSQPSIFFHKITSAWFPAPTLFTVHEPPIRASSRDTLLGQILHSSQWVTGVSEAMLLLARQLAPEIATRSSVIYNGLEMPSLQPAPLSFDAPRLLCIGRIITEKGFDLAIDALSHILHRKPTARLVIAGDGPVRSSLEQRAVELGLTDAVEFVGWKPPEAIPELINTATVVLVPSRWCEPFGLVALQAAQMARPVVATRVGGLPEVVVHRETGLLAERENSREIAEHVLFLLQHPEVATQMGRSARARARDLFSIDRLANDYDALYQRLTRTQVNMKGPER
jgi:glycogen(starch) synthase